jgi:hypothetical protein
MNLTDKVSVPPQVVARAVGKETVLLHLASGTYFGLDPVGSRIWQLMEKNNTLAEVCSVMIEEYEVSREELERDVLALLQQLADKQLVTVG